MIYLDHAAFTPVEPLAVEAMQRALESSWGNPNSPHAAGRRARVALEQARVEVAEFLGVEPRSVRFAGSASEALRRAIGFVLANTDGPIVSSRLEHPAVLSVLDQAERDGRALRWLARPGGASSESSAMTDATALVVSPADHELGAVVDVAAMTEVVGPSCWCVFDCTQAAAWLDTRACVGPRRFVVMSGPKVGGPPGVAAVVVPDEVADELEFWLGTPNWAAAIGLGAACRVRGSQRARALRRACSLGDLLRTGLLQRASSMVDNLGPDAERLGPIFNVSIPELTSVRLTTALDLEGVCIATGAACTRKLEAGNLSVRAAWPDEPWRATTATRWSLGWSTSEDEIVRALAAFERALASTRR